MSTKEFVIKDDNGRIYHPENLNEFKNHIKKYHTIDGNPDNSIHEENGYYFKIDNDFINILDNIT